MAKVDPYLRPLFDALHDMLEPDRVSQYLERGAIEVAPLAFMRGRTLNDSFIILDEAQNSTAEQMKMVITRTGFNSKMVVNGDVTQIDLPQGKRSGLLEAAVLYQGIPVTSVTTMTAPVEAIAGAIEARDGARFAKAFGELTAGCNACHQSMGRGFIVIQTPTASLFGDQSFAPPKKP